MYMYKAKKNALLFISYVTETVLFIVLRSVTIRKIFKGKIVSLLLSKLYL